MELLHIITQILNKLFLYHLKIVTSKNILSIKFLSTATKNKTVKDQAAIL